MYELLANCIPPELIMRTLLLALLPRLDDEVKHKAAACAAVYEHRMQVRLHKQSNPHRHSSVSLKRGQVASSANGLAMTGIDVNYS